MFILLILMFSLKECQPSLNILKWLMISKFASFDMKKRRFFFSILILYTSKEKTNDLPGPPED